MNIIRLEVRANNYGFTAWNTRAGLITIDHPFAPQSERRRTYKINGREASREECALAISVGYTGSEPTK